MIISIQLFDLSTHESVGLVDFEVLDEVERGVVPERTILTDDGQQIVTFHTQGYLRFHDIDDDI